MSWSTIVGQSRVKSLLTGMLRSKRLAHAYLFSGPEGSGQDPVAIEFARALLCDREGIEACGQCRSCARVGLLQHPNLNLVFALPVGRNEKHGDPPLARLSDTDIALVHEQLHEKSLNAYHRIVVPKANTIKINSVRLIRRESAFTGFERGRRIFIIFNAEDLSDESSNALLKTLEEPPENMLLLLTTSVPDRLSATLVSRCQHVRLAPLSVSEIQGALEERERISPEEALSVARLSTGSYAKALQRLQSDVQAHSRDAIAFLRAALRASHEETINSIEHIADSYEKQEIEDLLLLLSEWLRDAMILKEGAAGMPPPAESEDLRKFVDRYAGMDLASAVGAVDRAVSLLGKNVYIPLVLLNLALRLQESISPANDTSELSSPRESAGGHRKGSS